MAEHAELRRVVAEFLGVDAASIGSDIPLGLSSSLARARLDATLRRQLGIKCAAVYTARRFGELEAAVLGANGAALEPVAQPGRAPATEQPPRAAEPLAGVPGAALRCGVDIVEIAELPEAGDYWEHDLYRHAFSDAEIAYCSTQPNPREHFAARWAAKEAIKKLSGRYLAAELKDLEILPAADGAPGARWLGTLLPIALSLSHTRSAAVAVALEDRARDADGVTPSGSLHVPGARAATSWNGSAVQVAAAPPPSVVPSAPQARGGARALTWVLLSATAAVAVWALLRSFGVA